MRTIYRYVDPKGGSRIRVIERRKIAQPMAVNLTTFAVVLDVPGAYAAFETFPDIGAASGAFATLVDRYVTNTRFVSLEGAL